jgi:hypothetical protein
MVPLLHDLHIYFSARFTMQASLIIGVYANIAPNKDFYSTNIKIKELSYKDTVYN